MSLFEDILALLYRHDPVGLAEIGAPEDEYWPEVQALLPHLKEATSQEHLRRIIYSVFLEKFEAGETCGPESAYEAISREIWNRFLIEKDAARQ